MGLDDLCSGEYSVSIHVGAVEDTLPPHIATLRRGRSAYQALGVSVGDVAAVFTWKGLGQIIGAIVAGLAFPRITTGTWKLVWCGIFILFNGCAMAVMPFVSDLWPGMNESKLFSNINSLTDQRSMDGP